MYHLATNPEKQEKLQKECQSVGKSLSVKSLNELRYLKACIQESNRLTPTFALMVRVMPEEFNLHGYQIPKVRILEVGALWSGCMVFLADQLCDGDSKPFAIRISKSFRPFIFDNVNHQWK